MTNYSLESIIRELLIGRESNSENKIPQLLQLGINALREFNMDINPDGGSAAFTMLTIKPNQTVPLPHNYIDYCRIGILDHCGNFIALGKNDNMRYSNPVDACGNPIMPACTCNTAGQTVSSVTGINSIIGGFGWNWDGLADNLRNNELVGRFFGAGGGNNDWGYYRVNLKAGCIELGGVKATQIALEYLADPSMVDGEFLVHPYLVQALKAWIRYEEVIDNIRIPASTLEMRRREKFNEMRLATARFNVPRMTELQDSIRRFNMMALKF